MNITFLIGNGFDLHVGLKTSYQDFYPYFINHASKDNIIADWIKKEPYELWSDLELGLGKHIAKLYIRDMARFYEDRVEMEDLLAEYLEEEQKKFKLLVDKEPEVISEEFKRSILHFNSGLSLVDLQKVDNVMERYEKNRYIINFVTFNYTNVMDRLCSVSTNSSIRTHIGLYNDRIPLHIGDLVHVHGTTDSGMILGVNDNSQINNPEFQKDPVFTSVLVKEKMNTLLGEQRIVRANALLQSSSIIAVYGMSFGETDNYWWELIYKWLVENTDRLLIIYSYSPKNELKRNNPQRRIIKTRQVKNVFLNRVKKVSDPADIDSIRERILISFTNDLFRFSVK